MTIPTLVTIAQAQAHVRIPSSPDGSPSAADADLQQKIDAATQLICEYITDRQPPDDAWIAEIEGWSLDASPAGSPPPLIVLAVLEQTAELYRFRGDDGAEDRRTPGFLSPPIANLLVRYRSPSLA